jgi:hypothetical protein
MYIQPPTIRIRAPATIAIVGADDLIFSNIVDEVHSLREKKSTNFAALKKKAVKVGSTTAKTLAQQQSTRPSAQFLLRAARDELPKMIYGDLSVETAAEKKFVGQLSEAANALGLKSR